MPQGLLPALTAGYLVLFAGGLARPAVYQPGQPTRRPPDSVMVAANSRVVFGILSELLVERKELLPESLGALSAQTVARLEQNQTVQLTTRSITTTADSLVALVPDLARRYITSAGGRYFLSIEIQPLENETTIVRVRPTIVAKIPGSGSPLGGRLLPSNGRIERPLLDSLESRVRRGRVR